MSSPILVFDLDLTLLDWRPGARFEFSPEALRAGVVPNEHACAVVVAAHALGCEVVGLTARGEDIREETERCLYEEAGLPRAFRVIMQERFVDLPSIRPYKARELRALKKSGQVVVMFGDHEDQDEGAAVDAGVAFVPASIIRTPVSPVKALSSLLALKSRVFHEASIERVARERAEEAVA